MCIALTLPNSATQPAKHSPYIDLNRLIPIENDMYLVPATMMLLIQSSNMQAFCGPGKSVARAFVTPQTASLFLYEADMAEGLQRPEVPPGKYARIVMGDLAYHLESGTVRTIVEVLYGTIHDSATCLCK